MVGIAEEAMEVLAPIFEGPVIERTTEAPILSSEMPHVMVVVVPPPAVITDIENPRRDLGRPQSL